ncbi:MAG TPA: hypothetical protein VG992_03710 [Candidatus Saccharimonadales bacterium]|nr:hypothetical protein [Candidatus Saccharimonadales bacterium]
MSAEFEPVGGSVNNPLAKEWRWAEYGPLMPSRDGDLSALTDLIDDFMSTDSRARSYAYADGTSKHIYSCDVIEPAELLFGLPLFGTFRAVNMVYGRRAADNIRERYQLTFNYYDENVTKLFGSSYEISRYYGGALVMSRQASTDFYEQGLQLMTRRQYPEADWLPANAFDVRELLDRLGSVETHRIVHEPTL